MPNFGPVLRRAAALVAAGALVIGQDLNATSEPLPMQSDDTTRMFDVPNLPDDPTHIEWDADYIPRLGGETGTIHLGEENVTAFNLHSYLEYYDGQFFAIWSSGFQHEDRNQQHVRFATSEDGINWTDDAPVMPRIDGQRYFARGLWIRDGELLALAARDRPGPYFGDDLVLLAYRWDATSNTWTEAGIVHENAINNFPPVLLSDGEWLMTRRNADFEVSMLKGGAEAIDDWREIEVTPPAEGSLDEPSLVVRPDQTIAAHIRDNAQSRRLYRAVSTDHGETWSAPVKTDFPDARAKNYNLRLSTGTYVLINNPNTSGLRNPLTISLSDDAIVYDRVAIVADDETSPRFSGDAKSPGYHYPHAIERDGYLYVIYAENKEDIQVKRIAVDELESVEAPSARDVLAATIDQATELAPQGTKIGEYRADEEDRSALVYEIDQAQLVLDNDGASDADVNIATASLQQAVRDFKAAAEILHACSGSSVIIIDNDDPRFSTDSPWTTSTNPRLIHQAIGENYAHDGTVNAQPNRWAKWTPAISRSAAYILCMNYVDDNGNTVTRPDAAPVDIEHANGSTSTTIDQTSGGGQWQLLGTYELAAGADNSVTITASDAGYTIADAIALVPTEDSYLDPLPCVEADPRSKVIVGNYDSGVTNYDAGNGCTINNLIKDDETWPNHGAFVAHVDEVTEQLVIDDVIDDRERSRIMVAAARADVGR